MLILLSVIHKQRVILHLIYAFLKLSLCYLLSAHSAIFYAVLARRMPPRRSVLRAKNRRQSRSPSGKGSVGTILRSGKLPGFARTGSQRCCGNPGLSVSTEVTAEAEMDPGKKAVKNITAYVLASKCDHSLIGCKHSNDR